MSKQLQSRNWIRFQHGSLYLMLLGFNDFHHRNLDFKAFGV
jgi:hypothetical protein